MDWVKFHFLNVWYGNTTIIHFPERQETWTGRKINERITLIDFCHTENHDEYENVIDYYKNNFSGKNIFRYICTHPHHDHICGLHKLLEKSNINISCFWDLEHSFEPESFDWHSWHKDDWNSYKSLRKWDKNIQVLNYSSNTDQKDFWHDWEDRITILCPSNEMLEKAHKKEDWSNRDKKDILIDYISYAFLIKINWLKVVLAGDTKEDWWKEIYNNHKDLIKDVNILLAGHHWQESAIEENSIKQMNPQYIIFSNSKEEDDNYWGEAKYKKLCPNAEILKTCDKWTIVINCKFNWDIEIQNNEKS